MACLTDKHGDALYVDPESVSLVYGDTAVLYGVRTTLVHGSTMVLPSGQVFVREGPSEVERALREASL